MNIFSFDLLEIIPAWCFTFAFGIFFGFLMGLLRYMMIRSFTKS